MVRDDRSGALDVGYGGGAAMVLPQEGGPPCALFVPDCEENPVG